MQNHLNASDSLPDRHAIASDLYLKRDSQEASLRCDVNDKLGAKDFTAEIIKHLELSRGDVVVDVCCGSGQHLACFSKAVSPNGLARGFDFSMKAVAEANRRGVIAEVADAGDLSLPSRSVNALTCNFAVYYLSDIKRALLEWKRVLHLGGRLVISGPALDTNIELYDFHYAATGKKPSDADLMALGYIDNIVRPLLSETGFSNVRMYKFTNNIMFSDADEFISYWISTSLFIRSICEDERNRIIDSGRAIIKKQQRQFTITKQISIAVANNS